MLEIEGRGWGWRTKEVRERCKGRTEGKMPNRGQDAKLNRRNDAKLMS